MLNPKMLKSEKLVDAPHRGGPIEISDDILASNPMLSCMLPQNILASPLQSNGLRYRANLSKA